MNDWAKSFGHHVVGTPPLATTRDWSLVTWTLKQTRATALSFDEQPLTLSVHLSSH